MVAGSVSIFDGSNGYAFEKSYGWASYELQARMKPSYLLPVGSNTKFFTAVCIYQLHQAGLLNVHDPVVKVREASTLAGPQP